MQWYAGKCVSTGSPGDRITSLVAFSSFYGINTPNMAIQATNMASLNEHKVASVLYW